MVRFETLPGRQAQVDWGYFGKILIEGERRRLYAFAIILGYCRMKYVQFVTRADSEHFLQGHINAFHYFGGVPEEVVVDNLRSAVLMLQSRSLGGRRRH